MTIIEAISTINNLKPHTYTQSNMIQWLSELDGIVKVEIIDTHEGGENITFSGYTDDTDLFTQLLVSAPYEDMYIKWLESKIDYNNAEYTKYNNSSIAFNKVYSDFEKYYNRQHMPIRKKLKFF